MTALSRKPIADKLVVIARNATGQIITRITFHRDLVGVLHTGCCVLKLKLDTVRVEVHYGGRSHLGVSWKTAGHGELGGPAGKAPERMRYL